VCCLITLSCRIAPLCVTSSPLVRCLIVSSQTEEGTSSTTPPAYEDTWFVFSFFSFPLHLLTAFFSFIHIPPRVALVVLLTRHTSPSHHASPTMCLPLSCLSHVTSVMSPHCYVPPLVTPPPSLRAIPSPSKCYKNATPFIVHCRTCECSAVLLCTVACR
jgi:hypothetical protein